MNIETIREAIEKEADRLASVAPDARWYLFGSALKDLAHATDVDVLVVYRKDEHASALRAGVNDFTAAPPLHLLLMKPEEEAELQFTRGQGCVQVFPRE
jgi:predicted nucleotidyltransferase